MELSELLCKYNYYHYELKDHEFIYIDSECEKCGELNVDDCTESKTFNAGKHAFVHNFKCANCDIDLKFYEKEMSSRIYHKYYLSCGEQIIKGIIE